MLAYSSGLPSREGKGTCAPNESCTSCGIPNSPYQPGVAATGIGALNKRRYVNLRLAPCPTTVAASTRVQHGICLWTNPKQAQGMNTAICCTSRGAIIAGKSVTSACAHATDRSHQSLSIPDYSYMIQRRYSLVSYKSMERLT